MSSFCDCIINGLLITIAVIAEIEIVERLCSLLGMLDTISICPVAFKIFERLKKEYGFKRR